MDHRLQMHINAVLELTVPVDADEFIRAVDGLPIELGIHVIEFDDGQVVIRIGSEEVPVYCYASWESNDGVHRDRVFAANIAPVLQRVKNHIRQQIT